MKKIVAFACSVLLVAGMTLTAVAAPSPEGGVVTGIEVVKDKNGKEVKKDETNPNAAWIEIVPIKEEHKQVTEDIKKTDNVKKELENLGVTYTEGMKVVDVREVVVVGGGSADSAVVADLFPVTITFKVTGVTVNSKVTLLHYKTSDGKWEVVPCTPGNGTVTATFNSLSPVAFIVEDAGTTGTPSPTTGDAASYLWMVAIVMVAATGVAVVAKKKRA